MNQTGKELKDWLYRFHGVSTKYLQQYLNWFAIKRQIENANVPLKFLITTICASYQAMNVLKKIPLLEYI